MINNDLYCFGGEDLTLIYYYRCRKCGTIILEDGTNPECLEPWKCPTCNPVENFPFVFYTREQLQKDKLLGKLVGKKLSLFLKVHK